MSDGAREFVLKRIYLNPEAPDAVIGQVLLRLRPDVARRTFVFDRRANDNAETIESLQKMDRVGLLEVGLDVALVKREYLGIVNSCLARLRRGFEVVPETFSPDAQAVGKLAEEKALSHERERLRAAGYPELAPLVQQTSLVDQYAGYDILSYRGIGQNPEKPIYIEVKGTKSGEVRFIWSRNERVVATREKRAYWLYIYTLVNLEVASATGPLRIIDPITSLNKMGYKQEPIDVYVTRN
jgi:hypothetical protein